MKNFDYEKSNVSKYTRVLIKHYEKTFNDKSCEIHFDILTLLQKVIKTKMEKEKKRLSKIVCISKNLILRFINFDMIYAS